MESFVPKGKVVSSGSRMPVSIFVICILYDNWSTSFYMSLERKVVGVSESAKTELQC